MKFYFKILLNIVIYEQISESICITMVQNASELSAYYKHLQKQMSVLLVILYTMKDVDTY